DSLDSRAAGARPRHQGRLPARRDRGLGHADAVRPRKTTNVVRGPGIAAALRGRAPEAKSRMQIRKSTFASLARRAGREEGQVLLEYALLLALVAVVSI